MTLWLLIPILVVVVLVQITLLPPTPILGLRIDLPLIVVVTWGMFAPFGEAAHWGFIAGMLLDVASGLPFGIHTLTLTLIGLGIGFGQATFFRGNLIAPPLAMLLATLFDHVLILGCLSLFGWQIAWNAYLMRVTLLTALLNTVALPFAYLPLQWLHRRLRPQLDV